MAMNENIAIAIIEVVALEQLKEHDEDLSLAQRKVIADQIAREAWRRLKAQKFTRQQ